MESYTNYPETKLETAKANGYEIVMTPRLDADVSVGRHIPTPSFLARIASEAFWCASISH